jgi:MFS family permease
MIMAIVSFGVFVAADDLTVVSTMLRQIIFDLEIPLPEGLDQAAWIVNAYLIAYVVVMPFVGRLSDVVGRRPVYVGALILFLAGSVWVPLAGSLGEFIAGRVMSALGGGAMVPVAMAVIGDVYRPGRRATAMGTLGAVDTAGWVWGPFYGALLVSQLNWRWQFYLNVPLSLLGILAAWWALADLPRPARRERIDWFGVVLLTISLLSINIALLRGGDIQSAGGFSGFERGEPLEAVPLYLVGGVSLVLFVLFQVRRKGAETYSPVTRSRRTWFPARLLRRTPPLIDLSLFRRLNFSPAILVNFVIGCVLIIAMVNVPLVINVLEVDVESAALTSGYLLSGMTASMAFAAYLGGRLTERRGYRSVAVSGLALCGIGFGLLGFTWQVDSPNWQVALELIVLGTGFGLVIAPVGTAVINAAPTTQRGIASSLVVVFRLIGMSVGLSALTGWGLRRFDILRTRIELPDLPLADPAYQRAIVEGLTNVTMQVLTETFLVSASLALLALLIGLRLAGDKRV